VQSARLLYHMSGFCPLVSPGNNNTLTQLEMIPGISGSLCLIDSTFVKGWPTFTWPLLLLVFCFVGCPWTIDGTWYVELLQKEEVEWSSQTAKPSEDGSRELCFLEPVITPVYQIVATVSFGFKRSPHDLQWLGAMGDTEYYMCGWQWRRGPSPRFLLLSL